MINIIAGENGIGKTKKLIDIANESIKTSSGTTVFINNGNKLMYDIYHDVKLIDIKQYNINNIDRLYGFICGIYANNYDTSNIIWDNTFNLSKFSNEELYNFLLKLHYFSKEANVNFFLSLSSNINDLPDDIKNISNIIQ